MYNKKENEDCIYLQYSVAIPYLTFVWCSFFGGHLTWKFPLIQPIPVAMALTLMGCIFSKEELIDKAMASFR